MKVALPCEIIIFLFPAGYVGGKEWDLRRYGFLSPFWMSFLCGFSQCPGYIWRYNIQSEKDIKSHCELLFRVSLPRWEKQEADRRAWKERWTGQMSWASGHVLPALCLLLSLGKLLQLFRPLFTLRKLRMQMWEHKFIMTVKWEKMCEVIHLWQNYKAV